MEQLKPLNDILAPVLLLPTGCDDSSVAVRKLANVDSGAQTSLIALHVVREMCMDSHVDKSKSRSIIPYGSTRRVSTIGTLPLKLLCGRHVIIHEFDVMMAQDDVILGIDILPSVGISITGVPIDFPSEGNHTESVCSQQDESILRSKPSPFQLEQRIDEHEVTILMDGIRDLLDENIALDPAIPACPTIPEATMRLPLAPKAVVYRRQYSVAHALMELGDKQVEQWITDDFVEDAPASSPYNSSLLPILSKQVKAKTPEIVAGEKPPPEPPPKVRWVMDLRELNAHLLTTDCITQDIPKIQDIFQRIAGFRYSSTLDLSSAYQQLNLKEADRIKTTFTWRGRRLMWKRWCFGVKPATGRFQKVLEIVLEGCEVFVVIFVDDICVFTNGTLQEHMRHVREVITRLNANSLHLNLKKCRFGYKRVKLLGHLISGENRAMDPEKALEL